jgi:glycosyltransferase involved in cell wall biosynthesis
MTDVRTAVLIPCFNEELTIARVVRKFREQVPAAAVYVFDNNSSDGTVAEAERAGAIVHREPRQGKGYVIQSMFHRVDADVYVLVDGDDTYPAHAVAALIAPVLRGEADMVIGSRLHKTSASQFRIVNRLGNHIFLWLLSLTFGVRITDLLSGYRAFSRRFVRGIPLFGGGFETEAEMTIKALQRGFRVVEVPIDLVSRPPGSHSKIRLVQDGMLILMMMLTLLRDYKPLTFFGSLGLGLALAGLVPGVLTVSEYAKTGSLIHPGAALLALALLLAGLAIGLLGLILHTIARRFQELELQLQALADDLRPRAKGSVSA